MDAGHATLYANWIVLATVLLKEFLPDIHAFLKKS